MIIFKHYEGAPLITMSVLKRHFYLTVDMGNRVAVGKVILAAVIMFVVTFPSDFSPSVLICVNSSVLQRHLLPPAVLLRAVRGRNAPVSPSTSWSLSSFSCDALCFVCSVHAAKLRTPTFVHTL